MKSYNHKANSSSFGSNHHHHHKNGSTNGFLPNSLKFISSCIKTASSGVRSAGASVAASISSGDSHEHKDQVLWACFDRIELGPISFKHVLLLGYSNGFQVLDVEDASNVCELASKRDDPVTFLQMQPLPAKSKGCEGFRTSHPLLLVVASDESKSTSVMQNGREAFRDGYTEAPNGSLALSSTAVRFYSLRSHSYVHVLRFRSTVHTVRCSPQIVAIGLAAQIYCFDALTLENKFSVLTYPVPQLGGQGSFGVNMGYGPMDVGPRWLAYAPNNPLLSNSGRISPKSLTPSPGVSPSTSPSNGSLMARYAMESSKQLAAGLINLSDMGYKTLSRYYQELIPDGSSSPVSSNSSWKAVRATTHSADVDTAGMVVVKDFDSRAIISQFRAHTSPISALCFDPSGTLLVTASIHGNNINIFRIMPSSSKTGSGTQRYDWSSSHVHLYKLHRGVTSAVIQDICFSHYSQWIAIITAKGTCHIFLLSPFGGEANLQLHNSHVGQPTLFPAMSLPWWSMPYFMVNQQSSTSHLLPPPPVTAYVASRIKNCNSGWINSVSNAASSATGKVSVPSGAFAAVFHSSGLQNPRPSPAKVHALEHLLVFTPSGHVVQYELLPSMGGESSETVSRTTMGPPAQIQDEELRVKVEPLHWWDVCRRRDWPEKEECISGLTFDSKEAADAVANTSGSADSNGDTESEKSCDHSHFYIANAEVQMSFGRIPIWQQSKIYFYTMNSLSAEELALTGENAAGEIEIEKFSAHEVEIRRKDLLPVFDHFQRSQCDGSERSLSEGTCPPSFISMAKEKPSKDGVMSYPKLDGSMENLNDSLENYYMPVTWSQNGNIDQQRHNVATSPPVSQAYINKACALVSREQFVPGTNGASVPSTCPLPADTSIVQELEAPNSSGSSDDCSANSKGSNLMSNIIEEHVNGSLDFVQYFQEGYCRPSDLNGCPDSAEDIIHDDGSSSPCDRDKSEEEGDNDDMLGGVFAFSE
ncbi:autophagy-related protein 18h isoform X2 [Punica granatum]|uniref:Autophagy-related protein 18h isoform X2 n=1 Tax=Punica granatum TaxID=22663 RepID=A0A218VRN0_PUNGR|nr:autophagy-related protein 18h isoform X2 [Punica granatum]OWM62969.1 hypothetical protein CDL15_Pgr020263 [Punica granatum]